MKLKINENCTGAKTSTSVQQKKENEAQNLETSVANKKKDQIVNALWMKFLADMIMRSAHNYLEDIFSGYDDGTQYYSLERLFDMGQDVLNNNRTHIDYYLKGECFYNASDLRGWLKDVKEDGGRVFSDEEVEMMVDDYNNQKEV